MQLSGRYMAICSVTPLVGPTCMYAVRIASIVSILVGPWIGLLALGIHGFGRRGVVCDFILTLKWSGEGVEMLFHNSEGVLIMIGPCLKDYLEVLLDDMILGLRIAAMEYMHFPHAQCYIRKAIDTCIEFVAPSEDIVTATLDYSGDENVSIKRPSLPGY